MTTMTEDELQGLYEWVDGIPLSRPKRNISRDFSDGVLFAEVVKHFFPKLVDLHNYSPQQSVHQKIYNWNTLNNKVLKRLDFQLSKKDIEDVTRASPGAIERVLHAFQTKVAQIHHKRMQSQRVLGGDKPSPGPPAPAPSAYAQQPAAPAPQPAAPTGYTGAPPPAAPAAAYPPANAIQGPLAQLPVQQQNLLKDQIIAEKDETIAEMKETIDILEVKIRKLEQLVKLKDSKIQAITSKLTQHGLLR